MNYKSLLLRLVFFVILAIIFGYIGSSVANLMIDSDLPPVCKDWNKNRVMEISLGVTGLLLGISAEFMYTKLI